MIFCVVLRRPPGGRLYGLAALLALLGTVGINWSGARAASPARPSAVPPSSQPQPAADVSAEVSAADLPATVGRLVEQLDASQLARRDKAEERLIGLGPAALPLLPPETENLSAEVRLRLQRVRRALQHTAARASLEPTLVTLKADAQPLSEVLAALSRQSGNAIVDYRRQFNQPISDPPVTVDFHKKLFGKRWTRCWTRPG